MKKSLVLLISFIVVIVFIYIGSSLLSRNHDEDRTSPKASQQEEDIEPSAPNGQAAVQNPSATERPITSAVPQHPDLTEQQRLNQKINEMLSSMTLKQKIGQLLILGIDDSSASVSSQTSKLIVEQGIGNLILFKRNINSNAQLSSLILNLKKLSQEQEPRIPLWISIDQEGGIVNRLPQKFPAAQYLAELDDAAATEQAGEEMGGALQELSIDVNFAPVLDINNNPDNPVIGSRAFGTNAESVVKHSLAMLDGLDDYVLTVGKHFPGHGDTNIDSHHSLPVIEKSWAELEKLELIPFRAAIEQDIDAIMVGHLYLPQIDEQYPASLSSKIINEYLRERLGFKGIVITDDLVMGGITEHYEIGEAAVLAVEAGNTMLIVGHHPQEQQAVIQALIGAVEAGELAEELIDKNVAQVLRLKLDSSIYLGRN